MSQPNLIKGMFLGFCAAIIFGGTLPMTKLGLQVLSPEFLTAFRCALAGILAWGYLLIFKKKIPNPHQLLLICGVALCLVALFPTLIAFGLKTVDASHAGVVVGAFPICSAIMAVFINHEKPSPLFWLFSLIGGALVVTFALRHGSNGLAQGDILMFIAVICASAGYAIMGRLTRTLSGPDIITWAVALALPITLSASLYLLPPLETFANMQPKHWGAIFYLAALSQWIGFFMLNHGFKLVSVAKVSQTQLFQVFSALFLSNLVLSEPLELTTFAFATAVMLCVYAAGKTRHTHKI